MMTLDEFEERVGAINWMLSFAGDPAGVVAGQRVVEIGSGFAVGAVACLRLGASHYVGIDPEPFGSRIIALTGQDPGFRACYEQATRDLDRRKVVLVEGYADDWPATGFDLCLIADVMEHVGDPMAVAQSAFRLLRPGGRCIVSTAPLFYSASGHHLFHELGNTPWGHLYPGFDVASTGASPFFVAEYASLNRITHAEIVRVFRAQGFRIGKERVLRDAQQDFAAAKPRLCGSYLQGRDPDLFLQSVSQLVLVKP